MRSIAAVTSGRADYGLLHPVLDAIDNDPEMELMLIVTGRNRKGRPIARKMRDHVA